MDMRSLNAKARTVHNVPAARTRILGIDPGLRVTGYGLLDRAGHELVYVAS